MFAPILGIKIKPMLLLHVTLTLTLTLTLALALNLTLTLSLTLTLNLTRWSEVLLRCTCFNFGLKFNKVFSLVATYARF